MSEFMIALLAACMSTLGSLLLQMYVARTNRRLTYDEKRLDALLNVRQLVESCGGRWFGWASAVLNGAQGQDPEHLRKNAIDAMDRAWYATRVFEMYFPTMKEDADKMRAQMKRRREVAEQQVNEGGPFDAGGFSASRLVDLDDVVHRSRQILGYPKT